MNLAIHQAYVFKRRLYCAVVLYTAMSAVVIGVSSYRIHGINQTVFALEIQAKELNRALNHEPQFTTKQKEHHTMKDVKNHLMQLFSLPLPGISFSLLSLDEEGMHVRGNARTPQLLEAWLEHVSKAFAVHKHASVPKAGRGLSFEVLLHEKD